MVVKESAKAIAMMALGAGVLQSLVARVDDAGSWGCEWISALDAPVTVSAGLSGFARSLDGVTWLLSEIVNEADVVRAMWLTTGLGVYELYLNGRAVGEDDVLKLGFTDVRKTRHAYGSVLAWIWKSLAGIAADNGSLGFKRIVMNPRPDRRLGFVKASYRSAAGLIESSWRYEGDRWIWVFVVPEGAVGCVTLPGESASRDHAAGSHHIERTLP